MRRGEAHYYRIQGPSFLVEYDNTQSDANHVHTVWRDFDGDFGRDLLREHYRSATRRPLTRRPPTYAVLLTCVSICGPRDLDAFPTARALCGGGVTSS